MGDYGQLLFILSEPRLRSILHKFAEERHCSENIEFWMDIQLYKQQPTLNEAQKLYDKYFNPDSDHQLSFDSDVIKEIDRKMSEGTVGKKLFEIAERTIVQLILFSILPYFKKAHPIIFEIKPPENHRLNYFSSYDLIQHRVYQRKYTRFQRLQFYKYDTSGPPGQVVPPRIQKQPDYFIPVQSQRKSQTPPTPSNEEINKEESNSNLQISQDSPTVTVIPFYSFFHPFYFSYWLLGNVYERGS